MAGFFLLVTSRSERHSVADASFGWRALVSPPGPSPEIRGGALFFTLALSVPRSYQAPSLTAGERCRMTELLIGLVSWLATFGLIAAIIAEVFR